MSLPPRPLPPARRVTCVNCGLTVAAADAVGPVAIIREARGRRVRRQGPGCPACYDWDGAAALLRAEAPRRTPAPLRAPDAPVERPFACAGCIHGRAHAQAADGWECAAARMRACRPWAEAALLVARTGA